MSRTMIAQLLTTLASSEERCRDLPDGQRVHLLVVHHLPTGWRLAAPIRLRANGHAALRGCGTYRVDCERVAHWLAQVLELRVAIRMLKHEP